MARDQVVVRPDAQGAFKLDIARGDVERVHFSDIDLIVITKDGTFYVLPGGALSAMDKNPPSVSFKDTTLLADQLLSEVRAVSDLAMTTPVVASGEEPPKLAPVIDPQKHEEIAKELAKLKQKAEKQAQELKEKQEKLEQQQKELAEQKEKIEQQEEKQEQQPQDQDHAATLSAPQDNQEQSIGKFTDKMQQVVSETHTKDYDYVPVHSYDAPPMVFMGPPGVPAPVSLTPLVLLSMGNVVGTTTAGATIYGGGGADGSDGTAKLGPRDGLQFSAATITGTAGSDIIYAQGPLVGNADPSVNTDMYAKQFLMRVAGYFTELNDVVFRGLPSYVSVSGGTLNGDGSWTLPASYVLNQQTFELVYDKNGWRALGEPTFDVEIVTTGMMRNTEFTSTETVRFQFMDVTDANQSTNPLLTYWDDGQSKQIYILPTMDQPNIINHGEGDDVVYGSASHDTITGGDGNNTITAYGGNNTITQGDGDNTITATTGNDTVVVGDGVNTISIGDGNNTITAGDGGNTLTTGAGVDTITSGLGADIISSGAGADVIQAGDGNNQVLAGDGNDTIVAGAGDDTLSGEGGNDTITGGLGTNSINGGADSDTVTYASLGVAMTVSLAAGTATGAGVSDTLTSIENVIGSALADSITGSGADEQLFGGDGADTIIGGGGTDRLYGESGDDILTGGAGNDFISGGDGADTITGGGGTDTLYGDAGDDVFLGPTAGTAYYGGTGVDKVDYSSSGTAVTINLSNGTGLGGLAQGSTYNGIEWIVGTSGNDTLTGGDEDNIFEGGNGWDYLRGGGGNNTLNGGGSNNYYYDGVGADYFITTAGGWDEIRYNSSPSGIILNLDSASSHSVVNSLGVTINVAALTGTGWGVTAADANSYAIGDTFTTGVEYLIGSNYNDMIFGSSTEGRRYYGGDGGNDTIQCYGMNDTIIMGNGADRYDGGGGSSDLLSAATWSNSSMVMYLDGTADINANGTADYLERGAGTMLSSGYTGFAYGYGAVTYITNFENIYGYGGNDLIVGDANANYIDGRGGTNTLYGLGGNDTFYCMEGSNTIDGGTGTDTIAFTGGWSSALAAGVTVYLSDADLDGDGFMDKAATWGMYSGYNIRITINSASLHSTATSVENLNATNYADTLVGDANANVLYGNSGADTLCGNGGADTLYGGNDNDSLVVDAAHVAAATLLDGGSGTDTLLSRGWTFASGTISDAKYNSIERVDVRDNGAGDAYSINGADIRAFNDVDNNTSTLQLYLDAGDTLSVTTTAGALSVVQTVDTATDDTYVIYTTLANTTVYATLNVHYGA